MTTNHIKAILTSLRAMVVKMLPAYKFYLGSTTETTTTQIGHGVMSVKDGQTQGQGALTLDDASFAGFVEGETYTAVINGLSGEYVAVQSGDGAVITNIQDFENMPEDYWAVGFISPGTGEPYILMYMASGSYANATISISQTKTVTTKKYQTKKLDKSLLPDSVESGIKAANTKATTALSTAQDAHDTANQAVSDAATAQSAANTAQTTANTAKSTADAAKTDVYGAKIMSEMVTNSTNVVFKDRVLLSNGSTDADGARYWDLFSTSVLVGSQITFYYAGNSVSGIWNGKKLTLTFEYIGTEREVIFSLRPTGSGILIKIPDPAWAKNLALRYSWTEVVSWTNNDDIGTAAIIPDYAIASGIRLISTTGNKQFRLTVDDTGTLTATEVTDA